MFVSNPSTLAHICQSIRYNLVSVLLLSCFVKVRCLSYGFKSTLCPKSNPIHTIFTNCAPFPLHFHFLSISIWISTPLKGSSRWRGVIVWLHSPSRAQTLLEMQAVKRKCVRNNEEREREGGRRRERGG